MTQNVVSYMTHKEAARANVERERENTRHNTMAETLQDFYNRESQRHNLEIERQGRETIEEQKRHQAAMRAHNTAVAQEQARANRANEELTEWQRRISERQVANQAWSNAIQQEHNRAQIGYSYAQLEEQTRSHRASELNTWEANRNQLVIGMANAANQSRAINVQERGQMINLIGGMINSATSLLKTAVSAGSY